MVVATAIDYALKECVGEKMIESSVGIINQDDTHLHENTTLKHIRTSLSMRYINDEEEKDYIKSLGIVYFNDKELKDYVLHPDFIGKINMHTLLSGGSKKFTAGFSYAHIGMIGDNIKIISGFILDETGVGIINGTESIINGVRNLYFSRRDINLAGLISKEDAGEYNCYFPRGENTLIGDVKTPAGKGSIELCQNDVNNISRSILHFDIKENYNRFIKDFSLELLAKGN